MSLFSALKNKTYPAAAAHPAVRDAEREGALAALAKLALATEQNEKVECRNEVDVSVRPVPILEVEQQPLANAKAAKVANREQPPDSGGGNLAEFVPDAITYPAAAAHPTVRDAECEGALAALAKLALATEKNEKIESGNEVDVSVRPVPILEVEQQPLSNAKAAKAANYEQPPDSGCEHVAIDGISCVFRTKAGVQEYVRLIAAGETPRKAFNRACQFEDDFKQNE